MSFIEQISDSIDPGQMKTVKKIFARISMDVFPPEEKAETSPIRSPLFVDYVLMKAFIEYIVSQRRSLKELE